MVHMARQAAFAFIALALPAQAQFLQASHKSMKEVDTPPMSFADAEREKIQLEKILGHSLDDDSWATQADLDAAETVDLATDEDAEQADESTSNGESDFAEKEPEVMTEDEEEAPSFIQADDEDEEEEDEESLAETPIALVKDESIESAEVASAEESLVGDYMAAEVNDGQMEDSTPAVQDVSTEASGSSDSTEFMNGDVDPPLDKEVVDAGFTGDLENEVKGSVKNGDASIANATELSEQTVAALGNEAELRPEEDSVKAVEEDIPQDGEDPEPLEQERNEKAVNASAVAISIASQSRPKSRSSFLPKVDSVALHTQVAKPAEAEASKSAAPQESRRSREHAPASSAASKHRPSPQPPPGLLPKDTPSQQENANILNRLGVADLRARIMANNAFKAKIRAMCARYPKLAECEKKTAEAVFCQLLKMTKPEEAKKTCAKVVMDPTIQNTVKKVSLPMMSTSIRHQYVQLEDELVQRMLQELS